MGERAFVRGARGGQGGPGTFAPTIGEERWRTRGRQDGAHGGGVGWHQSARDERACQGAQRPADPLVGGGEGFGERGILRNLQEQEVVLHRDQAVRLGAQLVERFAGLALAAFAFVRKRDRGVSQDRGAGVRGDGGDERGRTATRATAEAGHEHDQGMPREEPTELRFLGFRGSHTQRDFPARPHAARLRPPQLERVTSLRLGQSRGVGVDEGDLHLGGQARSQAADDGAPRPTEPDQQNGAVRFHLRSGTCPSAKPRRLAGDGRAEGHPRWRLSSSR